MTDILPSGFEVVRFSDLDYEGMSVEIRYQGHPVAQLHRDNGLDACELVIPSRFSSADAPLSLPFNGFMAALTAAKSLLAELG